MFKNSIDISPRNSEKISQKLEQVTFNAVRKVLPDHSIMQACKSIGYTYRERKITPIVTVLHMIMASIWPEDSFNASWQVVRANFASCFPDGHSVLMLATAQLSFWTTGYCVSTFGLDEETIRRYIREQELLESGQGERI